MVVAAAVVVVAVVVVVVVAVAVAIAVAVVAVAVVALAGGGLPPLSSPSLPPAALPRSRTVTGLADMHVFYKRPKKLYVTARSYSNIHGKGPQGGPPRRSP